jgi:hypothetical protein
MTDERLYEMIRAAMDKQGKDLYDHSVKAEESAKLLQGQISAIVATQTGVKVQIDNINKQLTHMQTTFEPIITATAVNSKDILDADRNIEKIFVMIGEDRNKIREISTGTIASHPTFWELPVARMVVGLAILVVVGLIGLAGYNVITPATELLTP